PCVAVGEVAGPRVLGVAFDARRARGLPATGIEASDYLIIASMTFILGWAFLRRSQLQPIT
ncbi:MAG TPA: hypothetical protein VND22_00810, partial [Actinomycetota bacterium]|nr:hypothetical protein [Actinomycetota bacterium]